MRHIPTNLIQMSGYFCQTVNNKNIFGFFATIPDMQNNWYTDKLFFNKERCDIISKFVSRFPFCLNQHIHSSVFYMLTSCGP